MWESILASHRNTFGIVIPPKNYFFASHGNVEKFIFSVLPTESTHFVLQKMQKCMYFLEWSVVVRSSLHKPLCSTLSANSVLCGTKLAIMSTWQV
jgi:hypothetical protein